MVDVALWEPRPTMQFYYMPIRQAVYPSYGNADDTGVIIASYSWADDADFMGNLSVHDKARAVDRQSANVSCNSLYPCNWGDNTVTLPNVAIIDGTDARVARISDLARMPTPGIL